MKPLALAKSNIFTALTSSLLAFSTITPVQAANQCTMEYGFYIGGGDKQALSTVVVNINMGETKSINQAKALYARNLGIHPVHVEFIGKPYANVTLSKDQREPAVGTQPEATLTVATCPTAFGANVVRNPVSADPKLQRPTLAPGVTTKIK